MEGSGVGPDHRSRILDRIRTARRRAGRPTPVHPEPPAVAAPSVDSLPESKSDPDRSRSDLVDSFARRLESNGGVCHRATTTAGAVEAISNIVRSTHAEILCRSDDPLVVELLEGVAGSFDLLGHTSTRDELAEARLGITRAQRGVAEYGTIVLASGDIDGSIGPATERNRLAALLPDTHLAILVASDLVSTWDEALEEISNRPSLPPTVTFVTGPSRTTDIELELVFGVHGPRRQHVLLLEHL